LPGGCVVVVVVDVVVVVVVEVGFSEPGLLNEGFLPRQEESLLSWTT